MPKPKIKKSIARAEWNQIPKMGQIICFYVNIHVLKSEAGDFVILKHGYCKYNVKTVNILPPAQILVCVCIYKNLPKIADH